jgi:hypothetical protein
MSLNHGPKSNHWYNLDGTPCHTINGHKTTLRDARKLNLIPSVTSVMSIMAKDRVADWKVEEALKLAFSMTPAKGADFSVWAQAVLDASEAKQDATRDFGTKVHALFEHVLTTGKAPALFSPLCQGVEGWVPHIVDWFTANVLTVYSCEKSVVDADLGYAGRYDAFIWHKAHGPVVLDCKTQGVKGKPRTYPEWASQLCAYSKRLTCCLGEGVIGNPGCLSVVIDSTKPGPLHEHLWTPNDVEAGWEVFTAALKLWQSVKAYRPKALP